jgi:hypothetical protein
VQVTSNINTHSVLSFTSNERDFIQGVEKSTDLVYGGICIEYSTFRRRQLMTYLLSGFLLQNGNNSRNVVLFLIRDDGYNMET